MNEQKVFYEFVRNYMKLPKYAQVWTRNALAHFLNLVERQKVTK